MCRDTSRGKVRPDGRLDGLGQRPQRTLAIGVGLGDALLVEGEHDHRALAILTGDERHLWGGEVVRERLGRGALHREPRDVLGELTQRGQILTPQSRPIAPLCHDDQRQGLGARELLDRLLHLTALDRGREKLARVVLLDLRELTDLLAAHTPDPEPGEHDQQGNDDDSARILHACHSSRRPTPVSPHRHQPKG